MDRFDPNFFSTIAQVSATFMGFALLVPAIKSLSSGLFIGSKKYIKPHVLVKRFFFFISFPLFVLSNPLIVSMTILPDFSLPICTKWFVCISAFLYPFWLYWLQHNSKFPERRIVYLVLEVVPLTFFCARLVFVFLFLIRELWSPYLCIFSKWDTLSLVLLGFILIIRNLMITPEEGFKFTPTEVKNELILKNYLSLKKKDRSQRNVQKETNERVEQNLWDVRSEASNFIMERRVLIKRFKNFEKKVESEKEEREIEATIAESKSEIKNIIEFLKDIKKSFEKNVCKKDYFTLSNCADIEKRLDEAKKHTWGFRQGTTRLNERIRAEEKIKVSKKRVPHEKN